jgi:hypothetical protein
MLNPTIISPVYGTTQINAMWFEVFVTIYVIGRWTSSTARIKMMCNNSNAECPVVREAGRVGNGEPG